MGHSKFHPTCNTISLTTLAKLVALFDMIFGVFGLIWFVLMLSRYDIITLDPFENISAENDMKSSGAGLLPSQEDHSKEYKQVFATNHKVISLSLVAFYTSVNLCVFVLLMIGVHKRSPGICLTWFYVRSAIFFFKAIILIMYLIGGRPLFSQIPFIISMFVHLYGLWAINSYVEELRTVKYEKDVEEIRENNERSIVEKYIDDEPNGIEALQKKRIEEGLHKQASHFQQGENI